MHKALFKGQLFKPSNFHTCLKKCPYSHFAKGSKKFTHNKLVLKLLDSKGIRNYVLFLVPAPLTSNLNGFLLTPSSKALLFDVSFKRSLHSSSSLFHDDKNVDKSSPEAKTEKSFTKRVDERRRVDYSKNYTERNFITPLRAMNEYLLKPSDLEGFRKIQRRSPFEDNPPIDVYLRRDVEQKSVEVWGSQEALQRELKKRHEEEKSHRDSIHGAKKIVKDYTRSYKEKEHLKQREMIHRSSGRVVITAVIINATNFVLKLVAWLYTGSHSMFAEAIHSLADTGNQCLLFYGIRKSVQMPTEYHPYGYHNMRYVSSLISGVGIFFLGTGLSIYHGIMGIMNPETMESLYWAYIVLGGSLVSEGGTLAVAYKETVRGAKRNGMTFKEYVLRGQDPSLNVILSEDIAAVFGIFIAAGCMGLTSYTGSPWYDAVGSLAVGCTLGLVASFIIYTNTAALVGRSIPADRLQEITKELENDIMIRAIHDVKATDMGNNFVRFKAEVDYDGRELTRSYLDSQDSDALLEDMQAVKSIEDVEAFMLKHGESMFDTLGGQNDRIEMKLKKNHPEVRHVDLEVL